MIALTIIGVCCLVGAFCVGLAAAEAVQKEDSNEFIIYLFIICGLLGVAAWLLELGGSL